MSDDGKEAIWLERLKANADEASAHQREFLKWLDQVDPYAAENLVLPYSSPPADDAEPWK